MSRWVKLGFAVLLVIAMTPVMPVQALTNPCVYPGTDANGALYYISLPVDMSTMQCVKDSDLVIFAHGYVPANKPLAIPWDQMALPNPDDPTNPILLPNLVNGMGYAFATTSYSENGLAVKQGLLDILELIKVYKEDKKQFGTPNHIYLVGASEGGLVTTLAIEKFPGEFSGGLAMCGPIGSFQGQVNYWGDFRVVFDYFMDTSSDDILPGTAVNIPKALMNKWDSVYIPRIGAALKANPANTAQLFGVTQAPIVPANPTTIGETALGILWYNAFATNDAIDKLGGQPYDNRDRVYAGSSDDAALNAGVKRFKARETALMEIANYYETSGQLTRPLVVMHTTGDPIVPYAHTNFYAAKVGENPLYQFISVNRYGHCAFTLEEMQIGLGGLIIAGMPFPVR